MRLSLLLFDKLHLAWRLDAVPPVKEQLDTHNAYSAYIRVPDACPLVSLGPPLAEAARDTSFVHRTLGSLPAEPSISLSNLLGLALVPQLQLGYFPLELGIASLQSQNVAAETPTHGVRPLLL